MSASDALRPTGTAVQRSPEPAAPPCLVCSGAYRPSPLMGLFRCESCGFTSADLSISDDRLRALYGEDYFHGQEYLDYVAEADSLRANFDDRLRILRALMPDLSRADLFEIGCAYGFFLDQARGGVARAAGIDISADAVRHACERLGVEAESGDYLDSDLGRRVDIVAMWDTIEHLKRPDLFVQKAAADLRPGGLIALTTGDIGSLNARLRGARWRMIHPPTHLHYFSVSTLSRLLDRAGFDVVHVSHPGNARRLHSILYILFALKMKRPGFYDALARLPFAGMRVTLNLRDIMFVVGKRRL